MPRPIPEPQHTAPEAFQRLLDVLNVLREDCPWDRKQTMESLRHLTIEETYELADAILDEDYSEICKELGDVLMHLVFYAKIAQEQNKFTIVDVLNRVCEKLISRHPHIYADIQVEDEEEVKRNWENLKLKEGNKSVLEGVPKSLPAMIKAYRIQEKARGVGFDWADENEVWSKVEEEIQEFKAEISTKPLGKEVDMKAAESEFGDLLFALINYGRHLNINPENALERTNRKFVNRFNFLEESAQTSGRALKDLSLDEMNEYWSLAKAEEK